MNKRSFEIKDTLFDESDFEKECPGYDFVPVVLEKKKRIIVIGDIHGDLQLAIRSFKIANLIDDNFNWIANPPETVVVQVGDQIDSCRPIPGVYDCRNELKDGDIAEDIDILKFFNNMHLKAKEKGGAVYSLFGNHEFLNIVGDFRYVSYNNIDKFKYIDENGTKYEGEHGRTNAFQIGGPLSRMLACTRTSVLVIGSNMFVHAGVLPILADNIGKMNIDPQLKLKYLNRIVRQWILNKISDADEKNDANTVIGNFKLSPFWIRIYGLIPKNTKLNSPECSEYVKKALKVYRIGKIIVGHTPTLFTHDEGIHGTCYEVVNDHKEYKLYRVDGGFSRAFQIFDKYGITQVLEILNDDEFNILTDANPNVVGKHIGFTDQGVKIVASIYSQNRP